MLGPAAARLWQVDQQLIGLATQRTALDQERVLLLGQLRSGETPAPRAAEAAAPRPAATVAMPGAQEAAASGPAPAPTPRKETSPQQVQNTLLGLGALLLASAGLVFAAVTYQHLGVVGRAGVLMALTVVAALVPVRLVARQLSASAEAVAAVALVLAAVDAWALRRAGLGDGLRAETYGAIATGVLAAVSAGYSAFVPVRSARVAAAVFVQFPVPYLLARGDAGPAVTALALVPLGAVDLLIASEKRFEKELRVVTAILSGVVLLISFGASLIAIGDHQRAGAYGLLALAALAAGTATRISDRTVSGLLAATVAPLVAGGAFALVRDHLTEGQIPAVAVAVALLALQVCGVLSRDRRTGAVVGSLAVATVALLTQVEAIGLAFSGPFSWLARPWTLTQSQARLALATDQPWDGTVVTLVVLVATAGCALAAGALLDRLDRAAVPAGVLLVLSALVLPLGLATSYDVALVMLLAVGAAMAVGGVALLGTQESLARIFVITGFATALLAAVWSTASQHATLSVLPIVAVLAAGLAYTLPGLLTGATALLVGAELAAIAAGQDLSPEQIGGALLVAPALCVALSFLLKGAHRFGVEGAAVVLGATSVLLAVADPGWLSWTLAVDGLFCLALAIHPDRRAVSLAGGLLLSASSWVRLADAHVTSPEPYVAPLAVAALVFGHLRRRSEPTVGSFVAYGPGLSIALLPSLLKAVDDPTPTRGLLLMVVAGAVVVLGGIGRLRAPLVIGGAVVVVDALHLIAPYASALPQWTLLAGAGTLLVVLGATYEQRLRDVARLRVTYDSLT